MPRQSSLERDVRGLKVPHFAHEYHVRVLPYDGAKAVRKRISRFHIHLRLLNSFDAVFDRIFKRDDLYFGIVDGAQERVERRRFPGSRGPGIQDEAVRLGKLALNKFQIVVAKPKLGERYEGRRRVQNSHNDRLAEFGGDHRNTHFNIFTTDRDRKASILRLVPYIQLHFRK